MTDNRKKLYDALSSDYDLGTFDEFSSKLSDPNNRKKLYGAVSQKFDAGDYSSFEKNLGIETPVAQPDVKVKPTGVVNDGWTATPTNASALQFEKNLQAPFQTGAESILPEWLSQSPIIKGITKAPDALVRGVANTAIGGGRAIENIPNNIRQGNIGEAGANLAVGAVSPVLGALNATPVGGAFSIGMEGLSGLSPEVADAVGRGMNPVSSITKPESSVGQLLSGAGDMALQAVTLRALQSKPQFGKQPIPKEIPKEVVAEKPSLPTEVAKPLVKQAIEAKTLPKVIDDINAKPQSSSAADIDPKYAFNINKNKLNIDEASKGNLDRVVSAIKPELEKVKGKKLSNAEVVEAAQESELLRKTISREDTKAMTAQLTKLRQTVASGASGKGIDNNFIENIKTLSSQAANAGRVLQSFNIGADPTLSNVKEVMAKKMLDLGIEADKIVEASKGIDFNNPKEAGQFYREFVKPSATELIREFQYINLLSSPKTHIVNTFSNVLQGGLIAPATKLYSGGLDAIASNLTGRERQSYAKEVAPYYRGYFNAVPQAFKEFKDVITGNKGVERIELQRIPTGGASVDATQYPKSAPILNAMSKFNKTFDVIPRVLEANDIFFRTLIEGGEKEAIAYKYNRRGKNITPELLADEAKKKGEYYLFRKALDPTNETGQGSLLSSIDKATNSLMQTRDKHPTFRFFVPFVQTPMNILKQGIEYSPLGVATLTKNTQKLEQLSKALIGSTVLTGAAALVSTNESTWEAPTGKKQKEEFYDSGKQPYSIKLGDTWVSYSKLGSLAYPIALASAVKYHTTQAPNRYSKSQLEKLSAMLGSNAQFFSDQSYVQGIGSLVDFGRGEPQAIDRVLSNIPQQFVPLASLQAWVSRMIDPVYRDAQNPIEQIQTRIPFASGLLPAKSNKPRSYPILNSISPINISKDKGGKPYKTSGRELTGIN